MRVPKNKVTSRDSYAVGFAFGVLGDDQDRIRVGDLTCIFDVEEMKAGFADGVWSRKSQNVDFDPPTVKRAS